MNDMVENEFRLRLEEIIYKYNFFEINKNTDYYTNNIWCFYNRKKKILIHIDRFYSYACSIYMSKESKYQIRLIDKKFIFKHNCEYTNDYDVIINALRDIDDFKIVYLDENDYCSYHGFVTINDSLYKRLTKGHKVKYVDYKVIDCVLEHDTEGQGIRIYNSFSAACNGYNVYTSYVDISYNGDSIIRVIHDYYPTDNSLNNHNKMRLSAGEPIVNELLEMVNPNDKLKDFIIAVKSNFKYIKGVDYYKLDTPIGDSIIGSVQS